VGAASRIADYFGRGDHHTRELTRPLRLLGHIPRQTLLDRRSRARRAYANVYEGLQKRLRRLAKGQPFQAI